MRGAHLARRVSMAQQLSHPAPIEVTSTTTTDHENSVSERLIIPTWLSSRMAGSCQMYGAAPAPKQRVPSSAATRCHGGAHVNPNSFRAENSQGSSNRPVRGGESRGVTPYRTPTAGDRRVLGCEAADGVPVVTGGGLLPASLWVLERHDGGFGTARRPPLADRGARDDRGGLP